MPKIRSLICAAILAACVPIAVSGQEQTPVTLILEDNPAGPTVFLPPLSEEQTLPQQDWLLRTGGKKGVRELVLDEEAAAASDVAVLRGGFYERALQFLAGMQEPSLLVEPDGLAALAGTKAVLLIPSGGLSGTASSEFFKAGLAQFVRSGGTVVCLAQRTGADYGSLPVPEGQRLEGAGWGQDQGPLFGASVVREPHPLLSRVTHIIPRIETSGYLSTSPSGAQVLLARTDGHPTLMVYPYGAGRVVVTALFTDVLSSAGHADAEERALMQDLLLWAKAPLKTRAVSPGETLNLDFTVHGSNHDAAKVRITLFGSGSEAPASERIVDLAVKAGQTVSLPFLFTVPVSLDPGIYHFEYQLLDQKKRPFSIRIECAEGRMSAGKPPVAGREASLPKPLLIPPVPPRVRIQAGPAMPDKGLRLALEVLSRDTAAPALSDELVLRAAGREVTFRLEKGRTALTLDLGDRMKAVSLPVSVYHASGLLLGRDILPLEPGGNPGISLDHSSYLPGETARVSTRGLGSGELTLTGLGRIENDIIRENGSVEFPVPDGLPAGGYPLSWEMHYSGGKITRGETTITVDGERVRIADANVRRSPDGGKTFKAEAVFAVEAARPRDAVLRLMFTGPDGAAVSAVERAVTLQPGSQTISLPVMVKSEQAGVAALAASVSAVLPQGPGLPAGPVTFAERRMLLDRGNGAITGLAVDRPFFVEPSRTMVATAYLYGTGKASLRFFLAGKKVFKERFELSGSRAVEVNLTGVEPGAQVLRAELDGPDIPSYRELDLVNGTVLPDLVPSVVVGDITDTEIEIGISVKNEGKTASGPSRAVLSDGDPDQGGRIIQKVDVPALAPGQPHISIMKWPVLKRTGLRTLFAVADARNAVAESNKRNNREQYPFIVPDILMKIKTEKREVVPGEPFAYTLSMMNLSALDRKQLMLSIRITGPDAAPISSEDIPIDDLPSTRSMTFPRTLASTPLVPGKYLITAQLTAGNAILANTLAEARVPPVLSFAGTFEGTPGSAVRCRPFTIQTRFRSTGNIPASSGAVSIEIHAPGAGPPAFVRTLPFALEEQRITIDRLELPAGNYRIVLKVSASNKEHRITRENIIAEQPLIVTGPLKIEPTGAAFPRVLLWAGNIGGATARAALENMLRLAFQQEGIYYKIAGGPGEFAEQAVSGMFNVFVLLDVSDPLQDPRWLKDLVEDGQGMIISGSDETAKAIAGVFGFSFGAPISSSGAALVVAERSGLGLSGTIPVSGNVLLAKKKGALPLALTADSGQPAIFLDRAWPGKIVLMPFPLIHSSRESGTGDIYALLLRNAVNTVTPDRDEPGGFTAGGISLSSLSGRVKVRVSVTLPGQSHFVWASRQSSVREGTITFELTAGEEPQKVLYLHTPPAPGAARPVTEVLYECDGKYVSQGKVE